MESLSALQTICIVYKLKNLKVYKGWSSIYFEKYKIWELVYSSGTKEMKQ